MIFQVRKIVFQVRKISAEVGSKVFSAGKITGLTGEFPPAGAGTGGIGYAMAGHPFPFIAG